MRLSKTFGAAILGILLATSPVLAHHGWGGNSNDEFELTGTVERGVSLAGPHATMAIMVEGQLWEITLAPPARTARAGLAEDVIPLGATVTIQGHRNLDGNRFEVKTERVVWEDRTFAVYPNRN